MPLRRPKWSKTDLNIIESESKQDSVKDRGCLEDVRCI